MHDDEPPVWLFRACALALFHDGEQIFTDDGVRPVRARTNRCCGYSRIRTGIADKGGVAVGLGEGERIIELTAILIIDAEFISRVFFGNQTTLFHNQFWL